MNWQQQLVELDRQSKDFVSQIQALEARAQKLRSDRDAMGVASAGLESEILSLAKNISAFQAQTAAGLQNLYVEAETKMKEAAVKSQEAILAAMKASPMPEVVISAPVPPPPPKPAAQEEAFFSQKKPEPIASPPPPAPKAPPPPAPAVAAADDDDVFDLASLK